MTIKRNLNNVVSVKAELVTTRGKHPSWYACRVGYNAEDCKKRAELVCRKGTKGTIFIGKSEFDNMRVYAFVVGNLTKFKEKNSKFKWTKKESYEVVTEAPKELPLVMARDTAKT